MFNLPEELGDLITQIVRKEKYVVREAIDKILQLMIKDSSPLTKNQILRETGLKQEEIVLNQLRILEKYHIIFQKKEPQYNDRGDLKGGGLRIVWLIKGNYIQKGN